MALAGSGRSDMTSYDLFCSDYQLLTAGKWLKLLTSSAIEDNTFYIVPKISIHMTPQARTPHREHNNNDDRSNVRDRDDSSDVRIRQRDPDYRGRTEPRQRSVDYSDGDIVYNKERPTSPDPPERVIEREPERLRNRVRELEEELTVREREVVRERDREGTSRYA